MARGSIAATCKAPRTGKEVKECAILYSTSKAIRLGRTVQAARSTHRDPIEALIEAEHGPLVELPAKASSTAKRFGFADGNGEVGFVNPVSEPFCSSCDRIRLTADGQLRTCLFSRREWDLKTPMREGASDAELERLLRFAVRHKELKHKINDPGFVRASRSMSQIGG